MITQLINLTLSKCCEWVKLDSKGNVIFEDPIDKKEISAHYGTTHAAVAFIILGIRRNDDVLYNMGISLLKSILDRWNESTKLWAYHFDFNNFALCVVCEYLNGRDNELVERIKNTIIHTSDSNNPTINWMPMRWYVNNCRYAWTKNNKYKDNAIECKQIIINATNNDGGIEDRLPKGVSFNLQYDVATASVVQFLNTRGEKYDLSKELGFLLNAVAPDGDINYQGRGTNQIFAWSCWIYLLASSCQEDALQTALSYLKDKVPMMLEKNNIMLNAWDGEEKYLWWDYHYCSVYTAHFLFWLVLAQEDYGKHLIVPEVVSDNSTGFKVFRNSNCFVAYFEGRKEYLAELGPSISAIWTKKHGMIMKGNFASWRGHFGNRNAVEQISIRNFWGLIHVDTKKSWKECRIVRMLQPLISIEPLYKIKPSFVPIIVRISDELIKFEYIVNSNIKYELNIPSFVAIGNDVFVEIDGKNVRLYDIMNFRNQYDICKLYVSKQILGRKVTLTIRLR